MITMYKKTSKSIDNVYGFKEIQADENPFEKPCLLCLSAQTQIDKSVFGIAKVGASLARVRVRDLYNAGFDIDQVPINFLASRLSDNNEDIKEFVNKYFISLIYVDGKKLDVINACKVFRNINILTYCDGTFKTSKMEDYLVSRMREIGYSMEEVDEIVRQIAVVPIATDRVKGSEKMSVFSFKDINDMEVLAEREVPYYEGQEQKMFVSLSPNVHSYMYKGDGDHSLSKYAYEDDAMAYISYVLTSILENSVDNSVSHSAVPLNVSDIMSKLKDIDKMGLSREKILEQIDKRLRYGGSSRMSKKEALLLDKLDVSYDLVKSSTKDLEYMESQTRTQAKQILGLQKAIKENCSDINTLRILLEGMGWQVSKDQLEQIMNTPSDREIIEELDKKQGMKK